MNFFTIKTTWTNLEFIPLKLCIASAYILIGIRFQYIFQEHIWSLIFLFGTTLIWSVFLWVYKMMHKNQR